MKPTYRVNDWDKHFENHESRKVKRSYWVPIPNKHDGKSYRRIASHPDGVAVFAAWILILEAASKMPVRGVLADEDGPLDADDLSAMTGFPAAIFEAAFRVLPEVRVGWLEVEEAKPRRRKSPGISRNLPESPATPGSSAVELQGTELQDKEPQDREQNEKKDSAKAGASATDEKHQQDFDIWKLGVGKLMATGTTQQDARSFLGKLRKEHGSEVVSTAVTRMLSTNPVDPKAYLVGILQHGAGNGTNTKNNEFRRTTAAERNNEQLKRNLARVEQLRRQGGGDPNQVEGGDGPAVN